jgi:hypothetical protein
MSQLLIINPSLSPLSSQEVLPCPILEDTALAADGRGAQCVPLQPWTYRHLGMESVLSSESLWTATVPVFT